MRKRIGDVFAEKKILTPGQVQEVADHAERTGMRFGDAAVALGYTSPEELRDVFGPGHETAFFYLDFRYFPEVTRSVFTPEEMLRFGVVALGYKTDYRLFRARKRINIGLLDPSREDAVEEAERLAEERSGAEGCRRYLILPEHLISVLSRVYQLKPEELRDRPSDSVEPLLRAQLDPPKKKDPK